MKKVKGKIKKAQTGKVLISPGYWGPIKDSTDYISDQYLNAALTAAKYKVNGDTASYNRIVNKALPKLKDDLDRQKHKGKDYYDGRIFDNNGFVVGEYKKLGGSVKKAKKGTKVKSSKKK